MPQVNSIKEQVNGNDNMEMLVCLCHFLKRLLIGVGFLMSLKICCLTKLFFTLETTEWFFTSVDSFMSLQMTRSGELLVTI